MTLDELQQHLDHARQTGQGVQAGHQNVEVDVEIKGKRVRIATVTVFISVTPQGEITLVPNVIPGPPNIR